MQHDPDLVDHGASSVARLFDRHSRAVFGLAYALLRDADDAQDVVQEVFVVAWRRRRAITLVDGSALPWLLTTARLTALAMRRRETRRLADPVEDAPAPAAGDDAEAVRAAVAALPPGDRDIVRLVLMDGLSYAEAAARLGLTTSAAGKRLQRARARLRAELRPEGSSS